MPEEPGPHVYKKTQTSRSFILFTTLCKRVGLANAALTLLRRRGKFYKTLKDILMRRRRRRGWRAGRSCRPFFKYIWTLDFNIYVKHEITSAKDDDVEQIIHSFTFLILCSPRDTWSDLFLRSHLGFVVLLVLLYSAGEVRELKAFFLRKKSETLFLKLNLCSNFSYHEKAES